MKTSSTQTSKDLSKVLKASHENKWVAISRNYKKVVAFADSLLDLDKKVKDPKAVIYTRVLAKDISFAPASL